MLQPASMSFHNQRHYFIGGSDARIIMATNDAALVRLWPEKRGEPEPEDLSGNLIGQLGLVTEDLNQHWYASITGGMPLRWYIVAVCCGTIVILLGFFRWGILLMLLSPPRCEFATTQSDGRLLRRMSGRHGELR
jgi:hypothetical protein